MNPVAYFEIQADDVQRARDFYTAIFDWHFVKDSSIPIEYWRIEMAGIYGGLLPRPAKATAEGQGTNAFCCSMQVEDFDKTTQKILAHGGKAALEKFAVVGKCWQGYFLDTEGNIFGIFQVDEKAK